MIMYANMAPPSCFVWQSRTTCCHVHWLTSTQAKDKCVLSFYVSPPSLFFWTWDRVEDRTERGAKTRQPNLPLTSIEYIYHDGILQSQQAHRCRSHRTDARIGLGHHRTKRIDGLLRVRCVYRYLWRENIISLRIIAHMNIIYPYFLRHGRRTSPAAADALNMSPEEFLKGGLGSHKALAKVIRDKFLVKPSKLPYRFSKGLSLRGQMGQALKVDNLLMRK